MNRYSLAGVLALAMLALHCGTDESPGNFNNFGKVIEGMDTVNTIAAVKTTTVKGNRDVPAEPVVIKSATVITIEQDQ